MSARQIAVTNIAQILFKIIGSIIFVQHDYIVHIMLTRLVVAKTQPKPAGSFYRITSYNVCYTKLLRYLPHHWEAPHMGMRGIIGDRDDKYLLVLNGRVLNEKTHYGALSERDLPLLGDIRT